MFEAVIQVILVAAGAFVGIGLLVSYVKFERLREAAAKANAAEVEPRAALRIRISDRLGVGRKPAPFVVAIAGADGESTAAELESFLRARLRRADDVQPLEAGRVGLLLRLESDRQDAVWRRLREAWPTAGGKGELRIGAAAFPEDGAAAANLLERAEQRFVSGASEKATRAVPPTPENPAPDEPLDPLTGVLRSEDISLAMHKYVAGRRRENGAVSLLYADVYDLAGLNQRYGRAAGDETLRVFADILQRRLREEDLIGRLGDDDFLCALATAPADAARAAERVLAAVRETEVEAGGRKFHFTAHIGIAGFPDHGASTRALYDASETALAAARRKGHHAFALYEPEPVAPRLRAAERRRDRL